MVYRTTVEATAYFAANGCELLDEYTGSMTKMNYKCSCGNISAISWNNFTKGKRCGQCVKYGQKKKRSLEEVQAIFAARGCEFLDLNFKNIRHKHNYRCKCGKDSKISFAAFHFQEQYCKQCGIEKNKGEGNPAWRPDREQKRKDDLFRKRLYAMLRRSLQATGKDKVGHTSDMLGYSPKELQEHLTKHPDWEKVRKKNWHIDHIWPVKAFLDHGITDVAVINSLDNLRPSTQKANNRKWAHYDREAFGEWLARKQQ
jgi:hypothetical protein